MNWPPALAPRKPTLASGLKRTKFRVIRRADGRRQLAYAGHPLYRFVGDSKPGDVNGEGINAFGGRWYVLNRSGVPVKPAPAPAPGYGY
jgi:predicted lipoprotein with Yx(FWY)xxD motif